MAVPVGLHGVRPDQPGFPPTDVGKRVDADFATLALGAVQPGPPRQCPVKGDGARSSPPGHVAVEGAGPNVSERDVVLRAIELLVLHREYESGLRFWD
jgi:hypothetical protein